MFRAVAQPDHELGDPTLLLKRPWWRNYGHWLVDAAALTALLVNRRTGGFAQLAIGAAEDAKVREIMRETVSLVVPDIPAIEHPDTAMWAFAELHYVTPVRRSPLCALPQAIEALRCAVLRHAPAKPGDRRLFVSRRNYGRRRLANEAEIIEVCARHGFEVVFPELGTLSEQAALFRSASAIVGVKGAALANLVFSPPETVVVVLSPGDFADPFFWDLAGARGLSYSEIFGPLTATEHGQAQNPFEIDADRLDSMLQAVLPPPRYRWMFVPPLGVTIASEDTNSDCPDDPLAAPGENPCVACLPEVQDSTEPRACLERPSPSDDAASITCEGPQFDHAAPSNPPARKAPNVDMEPALDPDLHPDLTGEDYTEVLRRFHTLLRPKSYLEIGSRHGLSLSLAGCPSIAIDPVFDLRGDFIGSKPFCLLYRMRSDEFFDTHDPKELLGRTIDLAFLDGMHLAEVLLRDFMNTERHCSSNSVIALHDCIPVEAGIARRKEVDPAISSATKHPHWWTGDVWKVVVILKKFRPDLTLYALDAQPTGLIMISNLDPKSTVLADNRDVISASFRSLDLGKMGVRNYINSLRMLPTRSFASFDDISAHFGL